MTKSGYPFVVKLWKRGQALDQAKEVFRGTENDVSASGFTLNDSQGHHVTLFEHGLNFFESEYFLWTPGGNKKLALPRKVEVNGLLDNQLIVTLNQDWKPSETMIPMGSVIALDMGAVKQDPENLKPAQVFTPARSSSLRRCKPPGDICC